MFRSLVARALIAAVLGLVALAPAAAARSLVDPESLVPPVQADAECYELGSFVQCDIYALLSWTDEAAFELPCGMVYETRTDERFVTRWFEDNLLVRRLVHQRAEGTWSLSPTGDGIVLTFMTSATWGEVYTVPGDPDSAVGHQRGLDYLVMAADGSVIMQITGRTFGPEEDHVGRFLADETALCEALEG